MGVLGLLGCCLQAEGQGGQPRVPSLRHSDDPLPPPPLPPVPPPPVAPAVPIFCGLTHPALPFLPSSSDSLSPSPLHPPPQSSSSSSDSSSSSSSSPWRPLSKLPWLKGPPPVLSPRVLGFLDPRRRRQQKPRGEARTARVRLPAPHLLPCIRCIQSPAAQERTVGVPLPPAPCLPLSPSSPSPSSCPTCAPSKDLTPPADVQRLARRVPLGA